ncbi:hypothetical protein WA026_018816, partial [Henosepilachna vigintioctopunctata]
DMFSNPPIFIFSDDDHIRRANFTENQSYEELLRLDERLENAHGLSKQKIESLVSFKFNVDRHKGNQTSCVVCMFEFEPSQLIRRLPCSHEFHAQCIDEWFQVIFSSSFIVVLGIFFSFDAYWGENCE